MSYDPRCAQRAGGELLLPQHLVMAQDRLFKRWDTWAGQPTGEAAVRDPHTSPLPLSLLTTAVIGMAFTRGSDLSRELWGLQMTDRKQLDFPVYKKHKGITAHWFYMKIFGESILRTCNHTRICQCFKNCFSKENIVFS